MKTQLSKPSRTKARYTEEYKQEALELWRKSGRSAAKELLLNAEPKFPKEAAIKYNLACYFCQTGDIHNAKRYLRKAFEIDLRWRMAALEDEDLKVLWESL